MHITTERRPLQQVSAGALVVPVFEGGAEKRFGAGPLAEAGEITGKFGELTLVHRPEGAAAERVLFAGAGKAAQFDAAAARKLAGIAVRHLKAKSVKRVAFAFDGAHADAVVEGAILANFDPDRYRTANDKKSIDEVAVVAEGAADGVQAAAERGRIVAEAQNLTRELVNEPANRLTPRLLAEAAQKMAAAHGLECEILERPQMEKLGMGALLGVAQGSAEPPALIVIRYRPQTAAKSSAHLGLVGKGVTFDTGGISIKPAEGMEKMKYDMGGGAAMIGAMQAIAQLKAPIPVTAFIPAVENMPGSRAQRPGDIVTAMSGKTVEVINTDAEGRLILADALTYARRQGCTHLVDAATLTGAIVVALGHVHIGLFANDDAMRDRVLAASRAEGERAWAMPLDEDYKDYLKSAFA
ncbi:MAG TPA: leucyl aminopeptidase, partial [Bryobacteraceae bacterium]|nr:leucyl aminopeptidase [Bryobacteraceae bacterium]